MVRPAPRLIIQKRVAAAGNERGASSEDGGCPSAGPSRTKVDQEDKHGVSGSRGQSSKRDAGARTARDDRRGSIQPRIRDAAGADSEAESIGSDSSFEDDSDDDDSTADTRLTLTRQQLTAIRPILVKISAAIAFPRNGADSDLLDIQVEEADEEQAKEMRARVEALGMELDEDIDDLDRSPAPPLPTLKEYLAALKQADEELQAMDMQVDQKDIAASEIILDDQQKNEGSEHEGDGIDQPGAKRRRTVLAEDEARANILQDSAAARPSFDADSDMQSASDVGRTAVSEKAALTGGAPALRIGTDGQRSLQDVGAVSSSGATDVNMLDDGANEMIGSTEAAVGAASDPHHISAASVDLLLDWTDKFANLNTSEVSTATAPESSFNTYVALTGQTIVRVEPVEEEEVDVQVPPAKPLPPPVELELSHTLPADLKATIDRLRLDPPVNRPPLLCLVKPELMQDRPVAKSLEAYNIDLYPLDGLAPHLIVSPRTATIISSLSALPYACDDICERLASMSAAYERVFCIVVATQDDISVSTTQSIEASRARARVIGGADATGGRQVDILCSDQSSVPLGAVVQALAAQDEEFYRKRTTPAHVQDLMVNRSYLEREYGELEDRLAWDCKLNAFAALYVGALLLEAGLVHADSEAVRECLQPVIGDSYIKVGQFLSQLRAELVAAEAKQVSAPPPAR